MNIGVSEQSAVLDIVVKAAVGAALTAVIGTMVWWLRRRSTNRTARRREIRAPLVKYAKVVRQTSTGNWPGTRSEWDIRLRDVSDKAQAVKDEMDLDRAAAGRRWCKRVDILLRKGWELAVFCHSCATRVPSKDAPARLRELNTDFKSRYDKLT